MLIRCKNRLSMLKSYKTSWARSERTSPYPLVRNERPPYPLNELRQIIVNIHILSFQRTTEAKLLLRGTNFVIAKRQLQKQTNLKKQSLAAVSLSDGLWQPHLFKRTYTAICTVCFNAKLNQNQPNF